MKNKELLYIFFLILFFVITLSLSYGHYGSFIYDCFREAIIPEEIIKGKVLYKDIFCLFPPLGYYFNALIFKIFGSCLKNLYISGTISTIIILCCIYKIMKSLSNYKTAFYTVLTIMLMFVFRIMDSSASNWFFPYSYSFIYAFASCFISLTALISYLKSDKILYLYLSCLFLGISIAFKYDFLAMSLILLFFLLKSKSFKSVLYGILIFLSPTIISFLCFSIFAGNNGFSYLILESKVLNSFAHNPFVQNFNRWNLPQTFNRFILDNIFLSFTEFLKIFISTFISSFILYFSYLKLKHKKILLLISSFIILSIIIFIFTYIFSFEGLDKICYILSIKSKLYLQYNLVFLSYFIALSGILLFVYKKIKHINLNEKEKLYLILIIAAYTICFRNYAAIYLIYIGNFTITLFWMLFIYLLIEIIPDNFNIFNNKIYKNIIFYTFIIYALTYSIQFFYAYKQLNHRIEYPKGIIYVSEDYYPIVNKALSHAAENIKNKNKTLLYLEEGMYLHYFLEIPFIDTQIYALQSHSLPVLGEDYIINILKEKKPDYIYKYIAPEFFTHGEFGINYGQKVNKYILDNYELESITEAGQTPNLKNKLYILKKKQFKSTYLNL